MTDPNKKDPIDFDEIQLHSDVGVGRTTDNQPKSQSKAKAPTGGQTGQSGSKTGVILMSLLFVAAAGAAGYFYWQMSQLDAAFRALKAKANATGSNLNNTKTGLAEALERGNTLQAEMDKIQANNTELQKSKRDLTARNESLSQSLASSEKKRADLEKRTNNAEAALQKAQDENNRLERNLSQARAEARQAAEESQRTITQLETQLADKQADYQNRLAALQNMQSDLQNQLRTAESARERIQRRFDEESNASLSLIREKNELESQTAKLQSEVRQLKAQLNDVREQLAREQRVDIGELVPYSEALEPAQVIYREPLPDGVKVPRRIGAVAVQVLISEVGRVEKAFLPGDQMVDAELSAAVTKSMYNWKFSPPTLNGTKVKAWQTVLIRAE